MPNSLERDTNNLGQSFIFPPHVIDDIHIKSELGRYRRLSRKMPDRNRIEMADRQTGDV